MENLPQTVLKETLKPLTKKQIVNMYASKNIDARYSGKTRTFYLYESKPQQAQ